MTTPASSIRELSQTQARLLRPSGPGSWTRVYNGTVISERPQSRTNPLNSDGLRSVAGWKNRWGNIHFPSTYGSGHLSNGEEWGWEGYPPVSYSPAMWDGRDAAWIEGRGYFPPALRAEARTRLLLKLKDGKAEWGQTMAEAANSAKTIRDVAASMVGLVDRLARSYRMEKRAIADVLAGRTPRVGKHVRSSDIKGIPQAWLTAQFGIRPLLGDIQSTNEALDYLLFEEKAIPQMIVRAGASEDSTSVNVFNGPFSPQWRTELRAQLVAQCHLSTRWAVPVTNSRRLQQLGLGNPLSVAYEILPWSWAVDYVSTTGDWLQGLFAREGTTFLTGTESFLMRYGGDSPISVRMDAGRWKDISARYPKSISGELGRFERVVLDGPPGPWFPTFRNRLGLNQLANLTAALSQLR